MDKIEMKPVQHNVKIGDQCGNKKANITEDSLFMLDGEPVGFYIKSVNGKLKQLLGIANKEFRSDNVPKTLMERTEVLVNQRKFGITRKQAKEMSTVQMSTILGGVPPRPHMRRPYASISSVHNNKKAQVFIKAMLLTCLEGEKIIKEIMPEQHDKQKKLIEENCIKEFRFGNLFTSSISNFNIAAPFHIDRGNLKDCVNVIITKRQSSKGGSLFVPEYNACFEQADNSLLVYPAWRNMHGVTPIIPTQTGGYRNSLIFYPLKAMNEGK